MKSFRTLALFAVLLGLTRAAVLPQSEDTQTLSQDALLEEIIHNAEDTLFDESVEQLELTQNDAGCKDAARRELCDRFRDVHRHCDSNDPRMIEIGKTYCKKTCGYCKKAPVTASPPAKTCSQTAAGCCGDMRTPAQAGQRCPIELGCPDAQEALRYHNELRAKHGSPPLEWDDGLYAQAMDWARYLASIRMMEHADTQDKQGENLAYLWRPPKPATESTQMWYDEVDYYNYYYPDDNVNSLHFTQMIWKQTTHIGLGCAQTNDGQYTYVVARYSPKGNWNGEFATNVLRP